MHPRSFAQANSLPQQCDAAQPIGQPAPAPEVLNQLARLEKLLESYSPALDTLSARLEGSVMRGAVPEAPEAAAEVLMTTPMGSRLRDMVKTAQQNHRLIHGLIDRLEV